MRLVLLRFHCTKSKNIIDRCRSGDLLNKILSSNLRVKISAVRSRLTLKETPKASLSVLGKMLLCFWSREAHGGINLMTAGKSNPFGHY